MKSCVLKKIIGIMLIGALTICGSGMIFADNDTVINANGYKNGVYTPITPILPLDKYNANRAPEPDEKYEFSDKILETALLEAFKKTGCNERSLYNKRYDLSASVTLDVDSYSISEDRNYLTYRDLSHITKLTVRGGDYFKDLSQANIFGEILANKGNRMKDIGNFTNLEYLAMGNSQFSYSVDQEDSVNRYDIEDIKGLTKLKYLEISSQGSKSAFDFAALKDMQNLEVLKVLTAGEYKNVETIAGLKNLKTLYLRNWNKRVTGKEAGEMNFLLSKLKGLQNLLDVYIEMENINPNKVEFSDTQKIASLKIRSYVKENRAKLFLEVSKLSQLKKLSIEVLSDGKDTSQALESSALKNLPEGITEIQLTQIMDTSALSSLINAEKLHISTIKNTYAPVSFPKLKELSVFIADRSGKIELDARFFQKIPHIESLSVSQAYTDGVLRIKGITGLENASELKRLDIRNNLHDVTTLAGWEFTKLDFLSVSYIEPQSAEFFIKLKDDLIKERNATVIYGNLHNFNVDSLDAITTLPSEIYLSGATQSDIDRLGAAMSAKGCSNVRGVFINNSPLITDISPLNPWFDKLYKKPNHLRNIFCLTKCENIENFGDVYKVLNHAIVIDFSGTPFGSTEEIANKNWDDIVKKAVPHFVDSTGNWIKLKPYQMPLGEHNTTVDIRNTNITSTSPWHTYFNPMRVKMTDVTAAGVDAKGNSTFKAKSSSIIAEGKAVTYIPNDSRFNWRHFTAGKVTYKGAHYADKLIWKVPQNNKMYAFKIRNANGNCYSIDGDMISIDRIPQDLDLKFKIRTRPANYDEKCYSGEIEGAIITVEEVVIDTIEILKKLYNPQSAVKIVTVERTDMPDLSECINNPYVGTQIEVKNTPQTNELGTFLGIVDVILRDGTRYEDIKVPVQVIEKVHTVSFEFRDKEGALIAKSDLKATHFSNIDAKTIKALVPKNYISIAPIDAENNIQASYIKVITVNLAQSYTFKPKVSPEYVKKGEAYDISDNILNLPEGAKCKSTKEVDTMEVGIHVATAAISFSDGSTLEVLIPVVVTEYTSETFNPIIIPEVLEQGDSVDVTDNILNLPDGAIIETLTSPSTDRLGTYVAMIKITFADNSSRNYEVPVRVVAKKYIITLIFMDEKGERSSVPIGKLSGECLSAAEIIALIPDKYLLRPNEVITDIDNICEDDDVFVLVMHKQSFLFVPEIVGVSVNVGGKVDLIKGIKNIPGDAKAASITQIDTKVPGASIGKVKIEFKDKSIGIYDIPVSIIAPQSNSDKLEELAEVLKKKEEALAKQEKDLSAREQVLTRILSKYNFDAAVLEAIGDPADPVSMVKESQRGQIAKLIYMTLDDEVRSKYKGRKVAYKDTNNEIQDVVTNIGVFEGYPDGTFRPEDLITRAEYSAVLSRCMLNKTLRFDRKKFKDMERNWARDTVETLGGAGVIKGYPDNTFRPNNKITNKEVILMTQRLVEKAEN